MANLGLKKSLIVLAGARGTGKTIAASSYLPPSRIKEVYYHDGENSANRVRQNLHDQGLDFGYYLNLDERYAKSLPSNNDLLNRISSGKLPWVNSREQNSLIDFWHYIVDDIDKNLIPGKFSVYVHDPVERLESAMVAWVEKEKHATGWSNANPRGGMWTQAYYPLYYNLMEAIWGRGVDVIIFTAHLGNVWEGQGRNTHIVPGKVKVSIKPQLSKHMQLYAWLVSDERNTDKAPAAIIIKERLGKMRINEAEDTWESSPGLPRRVPHFTWDDIQRYVQDGFDQANPSPGEVLSQQESQLIDDTFYSDEQMKLMLMWAKTDLAKIASSNPALLTTSGEVQVNPASLARELSQAGIAPEQIAAQLGKPVVLINKWLSEN